MISDVVKHKKIQVPSDLNEVQETAKGILGFLDELKLEDVKLFDIRLCFEEALINAIKYGNSQKPDVIAKVEVGYSEKEIYMAIEDQGNGFNPGCVKDPTCGAHMQAYGGRGIYLIKHLMDRVSYNRKGNRVAMVKVYKKGMKV